MRFIIEPDYERMSKWAANYVARCINDAQPTAEKPFKFSCPTGSSPLGMCGELIDLNKAGKATTKLVPYVTVLKNQLIICGLSAFTAAFSYYYRL